MTHNIEMHNDLNDLIKDLDGLTRHLRNFMERLSGDAKEKPIYDCSVSFNFVSFETVKVALLALTENCKDQLGSDSFFEAGSYKFSLKVERLKEET